jgi:hypothetical protein
MRAISYRISYQFDWARPEYAQRLPIDLRALSDRKQVQTWMTEKGMTAYTFINSSLPQFSLDILAGESVDFARYDRNKVVIEAWDVPIPVVSVDDLIEMKQKVDREKDAEDVAALLQLRIFQCELEFHRTRLNTLEVNWLSKCLSGQKWP